MCKLAEHKKLNEKENVEGVGEGILGRDKEKS